MIKHYKAFKRDMKCRGFQYKEGEIYSMKEKPELCSVGFHFCKDLVLTLEYYPVQKCITENLYAEIEVLGDVVFDEPTRHKGATNKIKIIRVLSDNEVKKLIDSNRNSGNRNSGNSNSGYWNSGYWNSGNRNSGNWNSANECTGHFNTKQPSSILVFNKKCTLERWDNAYKPDFIYFNIDKKIGYKKSFQKSWESANKEDRIKIKDLPNFNANIFYEISGIDLRNVKL